MIGEIPLGWVRAKLGDLGDWTSGGTPSRAHPEYYGEGIPWVKTGDLVDGPLYAIPEAISEFGLKNSAAKRLPKGTLLVAMYGATIGRLGVLTFEAATNQACAALRPNESTTDLIPFLFIYLLGARNDLRRIGQGGAQPNISQAILKDYEIALPPLAEQKRIVAKVEELTARSRRAKEALDAVPPLLDQLRQSILAAAFRGDLTADWRAKNPNPEPADQLLARIRTERRARWEALRIAKMRARNTALTRRTLDAKYREPVPADSTGLPTLPFGWCWASADEVFFDAKIGLVRSATEQRTDGIPYVRMQHFDHQGRWNFNDVTRVSVTEEELEDFAIKNGDILFNTRNSAELVGKVALWRGDRETHVFNNNLMRLRSAGALPEWAAWQMVSPVFRAKISASVSATTSVAAIYGRDLFRQAICVAPVAEQLVAIDRVRLHLARIELVAASCAEGRQSLHILEQSLLAAAFRGELVPQDPYDEPASALLDRIRAAQGTAEPPVPGSRRHLARPAPAGERLSSATDAASISTAPASQTQPHAAAPLQPATHPANLDPETLCDLVFAVLWTHGPLEKDDAIRRVAEHLRQSGHVDFQRLRADGPLYTHLLATIESAVKAGRLDRPRRGHVRACKADATAYTADDWRHALVASLGPSPTERDEAIRVAAEWARENLGLDFERLRADGHIVLGLRSAISSTIRRGEVIRHDATHISRAPSNGQTPVPPTAHLEPDLTARTARGGSRVED